VTIHQDPPLRDDIFVGPKYGLGSGIALLAVLALVLFRPPAAYVDTGTSHVPLAVSSWCWAARCGAPIARSRHIAYVRRGATGRIELGFAPTQVQLTIGGTRAVTLLRGQEVTWRAKRGGGLSLTATGVHGFVTYVGRIALR
jgi:hypothetical protein